MAEQSLTITFVTATGSAEESIKVDLNEQKHIEVYGEAKSQFFFGETAWFRIFTEPADLEYTVTVSDGTYAQGGPGTATFEDEIVTFPNTSEASVGYPVADIVSTEWLGRSLGALAPFGEKLKASQAGVAVAMVTYTASYRGGSISLTTREGYDEYQVLVYIASKTAS